MLAAESGGTGATFGPAEREHDSVCNLEYQGTLAIDEIGAEPNLKKNSI